MSIYTDNGYKSRMDYLRSLSDDFGVDMSDVMLLADVLGSSEDFDGLVVSIEDYSESINRE